MMTLILIVSFVLIAFIMLLRYDIHKNKYRDGLDQTSDAAKTAQDENKPNARNKP